MNFERAKQNKPPPPHPTPCVHTHIHIKKKKRLYYSFYLYCCPNASVKAMETESRMVVALGWAGAEGGRESQLCVVFGFCKVKMF